MNISWIIYLLLATLPTCWTVISCKDDQYYDEVMQKCFFCQIICRGDTLHTECPVKCPEMYQHLQEEKKSTTLPPDEHPVAPPNAGLSTPSGGSGTQTDFIFRVIIFSSTVVLVVGVVVSGGFIVWYRMKPRQDRQTTTPQSLSTRTSGHTSLVGSRDAELAEPFLIEGAGGGSLPALILEETVPRIVQRPASVGDLAPVCLPMRDLSLSLDLSTGSVTFAGKPVRQPEEHPSSPTGNPYTESQRFRFQSDSMLREIHVRETVV